IAVAVLEVALPDHDEVPVRIAADRGEALVVGGVGVDAELRAAGQAAAEEALAEDPILAAVLVEALPDHDEVPVRLAADRGGALIVGGIGVDQELLAQGLARAGIALAEDPIIAAVLVVALPDHDEVPVRLAADRWVALGVGGEG